MTCLVVAVQEKRRPRALGRQALGELGRRAAMGCDGIGGHLLGLRMPVCGMAEPLSVGGQLGSYLLESVIGRGGMSTVYRARHTRLGTDVAVKVLASELSSDDAFRERFLREAKMAAGIDHPN